MGSLLTRPTVGVSGRIVGLAGAWTLQRPQPDRPVLVRQKHERLIAHQTGPISGVGHSGHYSTPGSLKARLAVDGAAALKTFCANDGIPVEVPGRPVVATDEVELPQLNRLVALLAIRRHNGIPARRLTLQEMVNDVARVHTRDEVVEAEQGAASAGLHSDRLVRACGIDPGVRNLPSRGQSREVVPGREHRVTVLVDPVPDPVPDPVLSFLGVHLARGIDGMVLSGPNADPALAPEVYSWSDVVPRDLGESMPSPGAWRLVQTYGPTCARELARSLGGRALVRFAQCMLPQLRPTDVRRSGTGVRAWGVTRAGHLVADFLLFLRYGRTRPVLNAPSPAATVCLTSGEHIARELCAT